MDRLNSLIKLYNKMTGDLTFGEGTFEGTRAGRKKEDTLGKNHK